MFDWTVFGDRSRWSCSWVVFGLPFALEVHLNILPVEPTETVPWPFELLRRGAGLSAQYPSGNQTHSNPSFAGRGGS